MDHSFRVCLKVTMKYLHYLRPHHPFFLWMPLLYLPVPMTRSKRPFTHKYGRQCYLEMNAFWVSKRNCFLCQFCFAFTFLQCFFKRFSKVFVTWSIGTINFFELRFYSSQKRIHIKQRQRLLINCHKNKSQSLNVVKTRIFGHSCTLCSVHLSV